MGSPISPLGNVTNPLGDVINGMLQGHQLGLQMRQEQMAEQENQLRQALGQQQVQQNDTAQRQQIINNSRPVNSAGMVEVPGNDPRAMATTPGIADNSQTPNANGGGVDRPTLQRPPSTEPQPQDPLTTTLGQMPGSDPYTVQPPASAVPATPGPSSPQLPQATPSQLPAGGSGSGNVWVKADSNRIVKYKDSNGNTYQGELYSPQEQAQRTLAAETAKLTADRAIPNARDVPTIQKEMLENEMVPDPSNPGKQIRQGDLLKAREVTETGRHNLADEGNTQAGQENQADIAEKNRAAAQTRADAAEKSRASIAADRNKTVLQAAGIRKGEGGQKPPTPTQLNAVTNKKTLQLKAAEGAYKKASAAATIGGYTDTDAAAKALADLHQAKQDAQDTYEGSLTQYGLPTEHLDYGAAPPPPPKTTLPTPKTTPPTTPPAPAAKAAPPAAKPKYTDKQILTNPTTHKKVQYNAATNKWQPI